MEHSPHSDEQRVRHGAKVVACGGMIGAAILFPLANDESLSFRVMTLSIFMLASLVFHGLHLEPFLRVGAFTAAVALVLLLAAVVSTGSSRRELVPWLPLFAVSLSLITIATHKLFRHFETRPVSIAADDEFSGVVSVDPDSERSLEVRAGPPLESNRHDPLYFRCDGPAPSGCIHRTGTNTTDISLSSVVGKCQPHWDALTRSHFPRGENAAGLVGTISDPDSGSETAGSGRFLLR